ncbi:MAG: hypothetical protein QM655_00400 [Nocardioidaceae bacterium]
MIGRWTGHLGSEVSALVDGHLEGTEADRAWDHVLSCPSCRAAVERETWVKRRLSGMRDDTPPSGLVGSLQELPDTGSRLDPTWSGLEAWREVDALEQAHRQGRRHGIALAGVGSAAAIGIAALGAISLGSLGAAPASVNPRVVDAATVGTTLSGFVTAPARARAHGELPGSALRAEP